MASMVNQILNAGLAVQSINLLGSNVKLAGKKRKSAKDFLGQGLTNTAGISLLGVQANLASGL